MLEIFEQTKYNVNTKFFGKFSLLVTLQRFNYCINVYFVNLFKFLIPFCTEKLFMKIIFTP